MNKSNPFLDVSAARKNPDLAIDFLAHHLRQGSLGLALGAGASKYLKLPEWGVLVDTCSKAEGLPSLPPKSPTADLCARMEEIEKKHSASGKADKGHSASYRSLVQTALYSGIRFNDILHGELLMALGALLMGSKRGSITEVINLNFDDVLEWYLYLHGHDIDVVTSLPTLRTAADVTIYHPHGFLPAHSEFTQSDFLIFSEESYDSKMGDLLEAWTELTRSFLKSKVVLCVGLSGNDPTFGPIFKNVQTALGSSRPTGVWMFTKGSDPKKLTSLEDRNFVVLELDDHDKWPHFLLAVCQQAARG